ncbi:MAG: SDR family oxidoreductase [Anaerolineae bacterium]|nr:SDR family oxidoreductase [Anaerolineae bacterium]
MRVDLTDQIALVTGAAHRVGKAIALELARQGVHILVHYGRSTEAAMDTAREIKSLGVNAYTVQADLSQPEGITTIFAALKEHFGKLHILVNSASNFQQRELLDVSYEDWQETLAINLTAPLLCTQAAAPLLNANDAGGAIVNILDVGAIRPWPKFAHHGVSKSGLWMLTQTSAASLGPKIRVNAVLPGPVMKSPYMSDEEWEKAGRKSPLQRVGSAEDVARAVAYLCMEDYLTGTCIHVNGGEHLWS